MEHALNFLLKLNLINNIFVVFVMHGLISNVAHIQFFNTTIIDLSHF